MTTPNPIVLAGCGHYASDVVDGICQTCESNKQKTDALFQRYRNDETVAELADRIHHSFMVSGPACETCIAVAIERLKPKETP